MILKVFKEKSIQKYVNKLLFARKIAVNNNKVKTIAVLLNSVEFDDFDEFRAYFKDLDLTSPKHKIIAFTTDDKFIGSQWETHISPKDFADKIGDQGAGKLKQLTAEAINTYFEPIRKKRIELEKNKDYVRDILLKGISKARETAIETLSEVTEAMSMKV